jgi:hypothetical protein
LIAVSIGAIIAGPGAVAVLSDEPRQVVSSRTNGNEMGSVPMEFAK